MSDIARADITNSASSAFFSSAIPADVMSYYENSAYNDSEDRNFIMKQGFREWLLAVKYDASAGNMIVNRPKYRLTQYSGYDGSELIILIANLMEVL